MNTALILEEYIRDRRDIQAPAYLAFLDSKSAFKVVSHKSLIPKLLNIGVEGNMWTIINSLHQDARSAAKFARRDIKTILGGAGCTPWRNSEYRFLQGV